MAMKSSRLARHPSDPGDNRNVHALDQAAGGSGDITGERASSTTGRPEHGTDDARCEDSTECTVERKKTADEIFVRIRQLRTASHTDDAGKFAMSLSRTTGGSEPKQERTDAEIRADIESRLKADQLLDDTGIFVVVSRGRVVIEGSVENHEAKQRAEAISRQGDGIGGHDSNLVVRRLS
ncbi:hypothetical protein A6U86_32835 [Rhizobium sp. AC27/96]|uniref:BON domain-containing protein n=1 Tax=Rhizobium TaxID=379 RepID=UPI00082842E8|nr:MULTISPECIES: BON domain-containing protein [Rhizobium]NTF46591.1 BON domain-containing protein [Rhizobium rhizogenes]OCI99618.1 hypothetical protein A6U86_32835 [Rhizobium sp. AC27/96]